MSTTQYPFDASASYAEYCYFHPFVRNFLYVTRGDKRESASGAGTEVNRNLRLLERADVCQGDCTFTIEYSMKVPAGASSNELKQEKLRSTFSVNSCWLYLFDTAVAVLELQLRHVGTCRMQGERFEKMALTLRHTMKLHDIARRLYAPYWEITKDSLGGVEDLTVVKNHHLPESIALAFANGTTKRSVFGAMQIPGDCADAIRRVDLTVLNLRREGEMPSADAAKAAEIRQEALTSIGEQLEHVQNHREPHTADVWQYLIHPVLPVKHGHPNHCFPLQFEHIQDDRVPLMSFIALEPFSDGVAASRRISKGDWLRLAMLDDEGNSDCWPYSPGIYSGDDPVREFAYDRFWHACGTAPAQRYHSTRWLCSGFAFVGVGEASPVFFSDPHAGALSHFRHHYMAMFLIGIFHRASLLQYKHRLAEISDAMLVRNGK